MTLLRRRDFKGNRIDDEMIGAVLDAARTRRHLVDQLEMRFAGTTTTIAYRPAARPRDRLATRPGPEALLTVETVGSDLYALNLEVKPIPRIPKSAGRHEMLAAVSAFVAALA